MTQNPKAVEVTAALRHRPGMRVQLDLLGDIGTQDGDGNFSALVVLEWRFQGVEEEMW